MKKILKATFKWFMVFSIFTSAALFKILLDSSINSSADAEHIASQAQEALNKIDIGAFQVTEAIDQLTPENANHIFKIRVAYKKSWGEDYFKTLSTHLAQQLSRPQKTVELIFEPSHQLVFQQQMNLFGFNIDFYLSAIILFSVIPLSFLTTHVLRRGTRFLSKRFSQKPTPIPTPLVEPAAEAQNQIRELLYANDKLKTELDGACHLWQATVDDLQCLKEKHKNLLIENQSLRERLKTSFKKIDFIESETVAKALGLSETEAPQNIENPTER